MTKEYLKMADEFSLPVKEDTLEVYCRQHIGESFGSCEAYSAHAINSHDELVAEVQRLREQVKDLSEQSDDYKESSERWRSEAGYWQSIAEE